MNRRRLILSLSSLTLLTLTGCGIYGIGNPGMEDVVGRWIEVTPGSAGEQGYVFRDDGTVSTFGYPNREGRTYACERGLMEMKGVVKTKDGAEMQFTHSYIVEQPDSRTMILSQGYERRTFRRAD